VLSGLCIGLVGGTLVHSLPTTSVTLSWTHSIEKTRWEEDYVVDGTVLYLREARIKTSGAGMDPPAGAVWRNGWWSYRPALDRIPEVVLANSNFVDGYTLCWSQSACEPMDVFVPKGTPVKLMPVPCADKTDSR
jgi:hypothetical protein